jgi:hypothetical protein
LEQIKITIQLTGAIEPDDLTPEARSDLIDVYRRWRSEQHPDPSDFGHR